MRKQVELAMGLQFNNFKKYNKLVSIDTHTQCQMFYLILDIKSYLSDLKTSYFSIIIVWYFSFVWADIPTPQLNHLEVY